MIVLGIDGCPEKAGRRLGQDARRCETDENQQLSPPPAYSRYDDDPPSSSSYVQTTYQNSVPISSSGVLGPTVALRSQNDIPIQSHERFQYSIACANVYPEFNSVYDVISPHTPSPSSSSSLSHSRPSGEGQDGNTLVLSQPLDRVGPTSSLIDPPHPSFSRSPAPDLPYSTFKVTALLGVSSDLTTAFPSIPPPSTTIPHLFSTHDVTEEDWTHFLQDVMAAGVLSPQNRILANVAPTALRLPHPVGVLIAKGIELHLNSKKKGSASSLVDIWNQHFFHPRRLHVVLARGATSYSGDEAVPPDIPRKRDNGQVGVGYSAEHPLRQVRRTVKRYREQLKRVQKVDDDTVENWRLVLVSMP